jgi:hypothetical protein
MVQWEIDDIHQQPNAPQVPVWQAVQLRGGRTFPYQLERGQNYWLKSLPDYIC